MNLIATIQSAKKALDKFNVEVADYRLKNGMSDNITHIYRMMGKLGLELEQCVDTTKQIMDRFNSLSTTTEGDHSG